MDIDKIGEIYQETLTQEKRKSQGIWFTSLRDSQYLTKKVLSYFPANKKIERILEPSCGGGSFYISLYQELLKLGYNSQEIIEKIIVGVDIDDDAINLIRNIISKIEPNVKPNLICSDFLLLENLNNFDIVIGNPPYIRCHNISSEKKHIYKKLLSSYSGIIDISVLFIEKGKNILNDDGILRFLIKDNFSKTLYGNKIRNIIRENIIEYENLYNHDFEVFANLINLIIGNKANKKWLLYNNNKIERTKIGKDEFCFEAEKEINGKTINDLGISIVLGIVTGYNKIFVGDHPKKYWTKTVLKGKDLSKKINYNQRIIYLKDKNDYTDYVYLNQYENELKIRNQNKLYWWKLRSYPNINWNKTNWAIKRIGSNINEFVKIPSGILCLDTCYILKTPDNINDDRFIEILNKNKNIQQQYNKMANVIGTKNEIHSRKFGKLILSIEEINYINE